MDHFEYKNGAMHVEQVPMSAIAQAVGTPVYVYSTATLERHVRVFQEALQPLPDPLVAFAVKANPNAAVLATLARLGLGADVVSAGAHRRAPVAGLSPGQIVFSRVGKIPDESALTLDLSFFQFT